MPENSPPKFNLHKVLAIFGIALPVVIVVGTLIWILTQSKASPDLGEDTVKVTTNSAKQSTPSAVRDETEDWKTLTNKTAGYLVKYPQDWEYEGTSANPPCDDEAVFLAPSGKGLLGRCSSGYGGLVGIFRSGPGENINTEIALYKPSDYQNYSKTDVTVAGKKGVKISGISQVSSEIDDRSGTREIHYLIDLGDRTLILNYSQAKTVADYSEIFEKIVSTLKFL